MEIRALTNEYAVSPQIMPEDIPAIVAAGFRTVICNRPDDEVVAGLRSGPVRAAAEAAGLAFVDNPLAPGEMSPSEVRLQRDAIDASDGPALAYCASGTRSTIAWMYGAVQTIPAQELVDRAVQAGYPLGAMRPQLEYVAQMN